MSVNVNTNTNTVTVQDASQTITIVDNGKSNTINIPQPLINVIEVATPGPAGPAGANGASVDISNLVTTSSFNAFTSSINTFTSSYNTGSFSGSFTGNLTGTASWAQYVVNGTNIDTGSFLMTASVSSNIITFTKGNGSTFPITVNTGSGTTIDTSSFATTGSNTFVGNQTISGNLIPAGPYTNNTSSYNLGSPTAAWKDLYVSNGSVTFINGASSASIKLSGSNVVFDGASVVLPTGSTVTAAATASYVNTLNQDLVVSGNFIVHNSTTGLDSINSDAYYLYDSSGNRSVMWNDKVLKDSNGATSIDWDSKVLYANDGTPKVDWSDPLYLKLLNIPTGSASDVLLIDGGGRLFHIASNTLSVTSAQTASYLNNLYQDLTLSGSLTILNNLIVFGTQSVNYITSSQLDISTNLITVNTSTPAVRFGGIAVRDSGSLATGLTGSLLWDSQNDVWIYSNPSGAAYDGGLVIMGPRNTSGLGNEVGINSNALAKGNGSHHITSSQILDDGTTVTIPGNLSVSSGITGSLFGTASWATNFVSASNYVLNNATSSFVTNSQTSSMSVATASRATTSSFAITSSFAQNVYAPVFITYTGGNQSNGATTLTNVHTASATMSIATIGFYEFELYTTYNSAATSVGIKYSLSGSNSFSYLATQVNYSISGSDRATFMFNSWDGGGTASSSAATTGNTAYIYGHVNATSTGPIFLRQASEIGGQTVTTTNVTGYLRRLY